MPAVSVIGPLEGKSLDRGFGSGFYTTFVICRRFCRVDKTLMMTEMGQDP